MIDVDGSASDGKGEPPPGARDESFHTEAVQGPIDVRQGQHAGSSNDRASDESAPGGGLLTTTVPRGPSP